MGGKVRVDKKNVLSLFFSCLVVNIHTDVLVCQSQRRHKRVHACTLEPYLQKAVLTL